MNLIIHSSSNNVGGIAGNGANSSSPHPFMGIILFSQIILPFFKVYVI